MKTAFVTGAAGQDGSYMCELLLEKDYEVTALVRPSGDNRLRRLKNCLSHKNFQLLYGDITDSRVWYNIAAFCDEVYHFAAMTHVHQSTSISSLVIETNTVPVAEMLDSACKDKKFYFPATSEMFGDMEVGTRADESHPLSARSPYAASKVAAHLLCRVYRQRGLFVVSGMAFNHTGARRGENFVERKTALGVKHFLKTGKKVQLGNIAAMRDWHHAKDTVRGIYLAMQHDTPDEYVFASGTVGSVGFLVSEICQHLGTTRKEAVEITQAEFRPWDVEYLCGNPAKAKRVLGWEPEISWPEMIEDICR